MSNRANTQEIGSTKRIYINNTTVTASSTKEEQYLSDHTFYRLKGIKKIIIPNGVIKLNLGDIFECEELEEVVIPSTVKIISPKFILYCKNLKRITVSKFNLYYCTDKHGVLYDKSKTCLLFYPAKCIELNYNMPDTVYRIERGAFNSSNLTSIVLSKNLQFIDEFTFFSCNNLESITIPSKVNYIGDYAFSNCINLKNVTIEGTLEIHDDAFSYCDSLVSVKLPKNLTLIDTESFSNYSKHSIIVISVKKFKIRERAFYNCKALAYGIIKQLRDIYFSSKEECVEWEYIRLFHPKWSYEKHRYLLGSEFC